MSGNPQAPSSSPGGPPGGTKVSTRPSYSVSSVGQKDGAGVNGGCDFGPDTPGTTTSGIQEAINAAGIGGAVTIRGTFNLGATVVFQCHWQTIHFQAEFRPTNPSIPLFQVKGISGCAFLGNLFVNDVNGITTADSPYLIDWGGYLHDSYVQFLTVRNAANSIHFAQGNNNHFDCINVSKCRNNGMLIDSAPNNHAGSNNGWHDNRYDDVSLVGVVGSHNGLTITAGPLQTVGGNQFGNLETNQWGNAGIEMGGQQIELWFGNVIADADGTGVLLAPGHSCVRVFFDTLWCSHCAVDGVHVDSPAGSGDTKAVDVDLQIANFLSKVNGRHGAFFSHAATVQIANALLLSNKGSGLYLDRTSDVQVGNLIARSNPSAVSDGGNPLLGSLSVAALSSPDPVVLSPQSRALSTRSGHSPFP